MTDGNEVYKTAMQELNNLVLSDTDDNKEEQDSVLVYAEPDFEDIPLSLLSYFETSKNRAAMCEKLLLEEPEDVIEDGAHRYKEGETELAFELENPLDEKGFPKIDKCEAEGEKPHGEERDKEEQKIQQEKEFQKELRAIMETEKLHQKELELREKQVQEKLEHEFQLQQQLINAWQKQVEEGRRKREEEQRIMKDKEERRRKEEKRKIDKERKRMEEEMRKEGKERRKEEMKLKRMDVEMRRKEEERRLEEMKLKQMEEKKRMEEKMRRKEEERIEEMKVKQVEEKKQMGEEMRRIEEERMEEMKVIEVEEKKRMEEKMRRKEEERIAEMKLKRMEEKQILEEELRQKGEEKRIEALKVKRMEEKKKSEKELRKKEEKKIEMEERMKQEGKKRIAMEERNEQSQINFEKKKLWDGLKIMEEENKTKKREVESIKKEEEKRIEEEKREVAMRKMKEEMSLRKDECRKRGENERKKREEGTRTMEEEADDREMIPQEIVYEERMRWERMEQKDKKMREERKEEIGEMQKEEEEEKKELARKQEKQNTSSVEDEKQTEGNARNKKEEEQRKMEQENMKTHKNYIQLAEEMRLKKNIERCNNSKVEKKTNDEEEEKRKHKERKDEEDVEVNKKEEEEMSLRENEHGVGREDEMQSKVPVKREDTTWTFSSPHPVDHESAVCSISTDTMQQHHHDNSTGLPAEWLPEHTERKRLSWMKNCIPWFKLSLQNRRKHPGPVQSTRRPWLAVEAARLPPLCPETLLQSAGLRSLREVTTVTLEDLPGCSLSTLALCTQLQFLSLRRCGLKSLEGIKQLQQLCYIDVQENDISFIDCENMKRLRVLQLSHNRLKSIHGLAGAENLDVLDLSHNSITRIAGLESVRRLQRLSLDHNELISTKGLMEVYTLLHLSCSHNHLTSVEGLENNALLNTLDLRDNSLAEPPGLNNHVLLRELHLDDNSISSLQGLSVCWLPHMQHLSVAQNRITHLPSMFDCVCLEKLDLRFNSISELQNVCESLEGCQFLREVHLTANPLQQESGWRSTLQKAVPGLKAIDEQETGSALSPPTDRQVMLAPGSFLSFCQAQLQQTYDLQQQHSRELRNASSLALAKTTCRHLTEALQLAMEQRVAHEYGDTTVTKRHQDAGQTVFGVDNTFLAKLGNRNSDWTIDENSAAGGSIRDTFGLTVNANPECVQSIAERNKTISCNAEIPPVSYNQHLDLQSAAAVVLQQQWKKYRKKWGNIRNLSTTEKGRGYEEKTKSGCPFSNRSTDCQNHAATVIQAFWRGFSLRKRLASALAAVRQLEIEEDEVLKELDMEEFVLDEDVLEKGWTLLNTEGSPPRHHPVSQQQECFSEPCEYTLSPPPFSWRSKEAWVAAEQVESTGRTAESFNRNKSPPSDVTGLSKKSEKIMKEWGFTHSQTALVMLKRAHRMKFKQQQQKKKEPSARFAIRNFSSQLSQEETRNRKSQHNRNFIRVGKAELGLQQGEKMQRPTQEGVQQWLHSQTVRSDRDSDSVRFLPDIRSEILNRGRVQLVADQGYTEYLHHASGLSSKSSLAVQPQKQKSYPRRNESGERFPSPKQVLAAPSKTERISFRDNPVRLSGGWGAGRKKVKVYK